MRSQNIDYSKADKQWINKLNQQIKLNMWHAYDSNLVKKHPFLSCTEILQCIRTRRFKLITASTLRFTKKLQNLLLKTLILLTERLKIFTKTINIFRTKIISYQKWNVFILFKIEICQTALIAFIRLRCLVYWECYYKKYFFVDANLIW